mgnify:CR=1 FL=1
MCEDDQHLENRLGLDVGPDRCIFGDDNAWFGVRVRYDGQGEILAAVGGREEEVRGTG